MALMLKGVGQKSFQFCFHVIFSDVFIPFHDINQIVVVLPSHTLSGI